MQISKGNGIISIIADKNVTSYATSDFKHADMSGYIIEEPTTKELRKLYEVAQRIFWNMKAKRKRNAKSAFLCV
ncbi:hypothetical protein [Neobacillus ginsengisoli]|uniref:Uncharacterized protein n=1 Tax=Neobacillus ginsengisoli TaxID=904295 RepID=A0ABT9XSG2_9BACI|nr:hypothetical protein [Neobacillus ginsengisoli]MDQ0197879.1 hypothetical protein [Neobacillus ginsengisoli]